MLFGKFRDKRDAATHSPGFNLDHPAIVAGSYIALMVFAVLLHRGAWNGTWRLDDGRQLLSVINNPFWRLLSDHDAWMTFAWNAFTPILAGQYWVDIHLFGLKARGFNLHHAVELAITTMASYHLLSRRIPRHLSMLATIGFIVALPTFTVMNFLNCRHYLTGLLLTIGSVYMYHRALRNGRSRSLFISAGLFLMAMLAKELYAVSLLYFFLTSWRTPFFRRVLALYLFNLAIFVAWRTYILKSLLGGYPHDSPFIERFAPLVEVHRAIFGSDLAAAIFIASVIFLILRHRLFCVRHFVGLAAFLLAVYLPPFLATIVLQLGGYCALRLSFFPVWLCAAGLAYIAMQLHQAGARKTALILLLAFIAVVATSTARRMGNFRDEIREHDIQAKFVENAGPESALFPTSLLGYDYDLQRVVLAGGHNPAGLVQFREDIHPNFKSYWEYEKHCRCMVKLNNAKVLEKASHLEKLNKSPAESGAPISILATLQASQGLVSITVEPEGDSWCLLSVPGMIYYIVCSNPMFPNASRIPQDKFGLMHAQIARGRQDGLVIFAPYMSVPMDGTLQWSRGVFLPTSQIEGTSGTCHVNTPGNTELMQPRRTPLELRGWILGPSNLLPDAIPLAILAGSTGKYYVANLYREQRNDVTNSDGVIIGGHVLDADLRRVEPGIYRLLMGIENTTCDTRITMTIR